MATVNLTVIDETLRRMMSEPRTPPAFVWPAIHVPDHEDNCGSRCRYAGAMVPIDDLQGHDCCGFCNDLPGDVEVDSWLGPGMGNYQSWVIECTLRQRIL